MNEHKAWETRPNFEYHGYIDKSGKLKIFSKNIDDEMPTELPKGSVCNNKTSEQLAEIMKSLDIPLEAENVDERCKLIRERLDELGRLKTVV